MYGYVPVDMTNMVPMVMFPGAMPPHVMAMSTAGPLAPGVVLANGVTLPEGSPSDPKGGSVMFDHHHSVLQHLSVFQPQG